MPLFSLHLLCIFLLLLLPPLFLIFTAAAIHPFHKLSRKLHRLISTSSARFSGPPTFPVIGCLIPYLNNRCRLLDWYTELLSESDTSTITISRLGTRRTIVTANPRNIEYILKTNFNNFPKGKRFTEILGDFLGYGIFNVDGELWRRQRKLVSHEFSAKSLNEFVINTIEDEVENRLLPVLESLAAESKVVDLQDLLRRLAFNVICGVSLGVKRYCLDPSSTVSPVSTAFDIASEICAKRGAAPFDLIWKVKKWLQIGSEKRLREAVEQIHEYVEEIIRNKKKKIGLNGNCDKDLLSRLILANQEEDVTRDMVISMLMAGRDTTSAAMTWLFWLISCNPKVEQDIVNEITQNVQNKNNNNKLDCESLKEFNFLKACLCETMRLFPPVAWDSKHALTNDVLPDGTPVFAGDRVTYFPYGMGRMERLWGKDRFEFRPERWFMAGTTEENDEVRRGELVLKQVCPYKFPVFQAGPRVCLGKEMAFAQMKYVVASILRRFEIRPVKNDEPVFVPLLTAHMAGGLKVVIRRRDWRRENIN